MSASSSSPARPPGTPSPRTGPMPTADYRSSFQWCANRRDRENGRTARSPDDRRVSLEPALSIQRSVVAAKGRSSCRARGFRLLSASARGPVTTVSCQRARRLACRRGSRREELLGFGWLLDVPLAVSLPQRLIRHQLLGGEVDGHFGLLHVVDQA